MKPTLRIPPSLGVRLLTAMLAACVSTPASFAQVTGFNQAAAGTYDYTTASNWVDADINGIWDASLALTGNQTLTFGADTTLSDGVALRYTGNADLTFRAEGGARTITLEGDVFHGSGANRTVTFGSTTGSQNLFVNLGGETRTFTVFGGGNSNNFARTLSFINNLSNGGVIVSGGGSGGGLVRLAGTANTLDSLEVRDADVSIHGAANSGVNTSTTISGSLTAGARPGSVTLTTHASRNTLLQANTFSREAGSTLLFRGTNLGVNSIASATANSANVQFTSAPTLSGSGPAGTTTVGIIAGAFGDTSASGSGFGATGGLVTYDSVNGVRLLSASEYKTSIDDGQSSLDNIKLANSSGTVATTTLTTPLTTINSLSMEVTGTPGGQGITIAGGAGTTLKINSGVIYAYQNVSANPTATDAMTLDVETLDLNGQEGIILAGTRMNSGGTATSSGGLIINSAITNGTGLTIADSLGSPGGYVALGGSTANTYTGNTTINGAIVRFQKSITNSFGDLVLNLGSVYNTGNQFADSANITINGGVFYLNGTNNSGSASSETINDLTMTYGTISSGSGNSNTLNVEGDANLSGGTINMARNAKLNIAGTTALSGGVISVGTNNSATVYNSRTTLGAVDITNTAKGTSPYTPITIAAGLSAGNLGGHVELSGDVTFTGNSNKNTVTIAAPTGTGLQGVMALNGIRTFNIGNGAAANDLTIEAPLIDGSSTGGLIKTGLGTLALTGVNTYTGATVINQGTLALSGDGALSAASALTIAAGATLDTSAQASYVFSTVATTTIGFGASSAGLIKAATATFSNAALVFDFGDLTTLDAVYDVFEISGLTEGNFASVTATGDNINGSFVDVGDGTWTFSSGALNITFNAYDGTLASIPEPAAFGFLAGAGLLGFAAFRRRRHHN